MQERRVLLSGHIAESFLLMDRVRRSLLLIGQTSEELVAYWSSRRSWLVIGKSDVVSFLSPLVTVTQSVFDDWPGLTKLAADWPGLTNLAADWPCLMELVGLVDFLLIDEAH
jgi:hypothetical protein